MSLELSPVLSVLYALIGQDHFPSAEQPVSIHSMLYVLDAVLALGGNDVLDPAPSFLQGEGS